MRLISVARALEALGGIREGRENIVCIDSSRYSLNSLRMFSIISPRALDCFDTLDTFSKSTGILLDGVIDTIRESSRSFQGIRESLDGIDSIKSIETSSRCFR